MTVRHCARRRAISARSYSAASTVFFKAEPFGMHEAPDRAVVDRESALGQLRHQPARREAGAAAALDQPAPMRAGLDTGCRIDVA
jgi:hypothetical protein